MTAQNRQVETGHHLNLTGGQFPRGYFMRIAVLSLIACLVPTIASAQCKSSYDFTALHLKQFSDPKLALVANALTSASMPTVLQQAKAGGSDKKATYDAVLAQAATIAKKSEDSFAHAKELSAGDDSMEHYLAEGLPSDFKCEGDYNTAVCVGFMYLWTKESALQTAEAIQCGW